MASLSFGLLAWGALAGCDGDGKPDTGYGREKPIPSTVNCADTCRRAADCGGHLCAEDMRNDEYIDLFGVLESLCESSCNPSELTAKATSTVWTCMFKASCREVYDYDACHMQAYYYCK